MRRILVTWLRKSEKIDFRNRIDDEEGATAVEYGMLVALIAAVIVGVVQTLGTQIQTAFQAIVTALTP
jgi:pilus assembly protein Flp/PilA